METDHGEDHYLNSNLRRLLGYSPEAGENSKYLRPDGSGSSREISNSSPDHHANQTNLPVTYFGPIHPSNEALRGMWHEVTLEETGSLVVQNNYVEDEKASVLSIKKLRKRDLTILTLFIGSLRQLMLFAWRLGPAW